MYAWCVVGIIAIPCIWQRIWTAVGKRETFESVALLVWDNFNDVEEKDIMSVWSAMMYWLMN